MRDDEVLAPGLADDARIREIVRHVRTDRLPHAVEDTGATGEVHARQLAMGEADVGDLRRVSGHHVDDAGRQAGGLQELHDVIP